MIVLSDRDSLLGFASIDMPSSVRVHVARHVRLATENDLLDLTCLAVVEAGDTEAEIEAALGFNPLVQHIDGTHISSADFRPYWDWLRDHGAWWEMIYTIGDSGFAHVILIEAGFVRPYASSPVPPSASFNGMGSG